MSVSNKNIKFKGEPLKVTGTELKVGDIAPNVKLVSGDMADVDLNSFFNKTVILSIVPSLDTPVCAVQTKKFNEEIDNYNGQAVVVTVSRDLPFAQKRWCGSEGVESVYCLSDYKYRQMGSAYGAEIESWGLLARAVMVIAPGGKITHLEYVSEISQEPNYEEVLKALGTLVKK